MRYRIDMSYDGAPFCGWQVQPSSPSVQGELERVLGVLLKAPVGVVGAGRTDTGVSAVHYVAHFDCDTPFDCGQLRYKMNAILPKAIAIQGISPAPDGFHARFDAKCRQYQYFLHRVKDPFLETRSYYFGYPEVDFEVMNKAASALLGTHDFSCFEKSGGDNKTSVCTVSRAIWEPFCPELSVARLQFENELITGAGMPADGLSAGGGEPSFWRFTIEADRFLRNMVRAIVGTLLEVGRGRRTLEDFVSLVLPPDRGLSANDSSTEVLPPDRGTAANDPSTGVILPDCCDSANRAIPPAPKSTVSLRSAAGESVPGHALYLTDVRY